MMARLQTALGRLAGMTRGDGLRATLVRGALGSAGVQAANRVLALVLGVILARALGPEGYGVYAYAFAIMSLLMVVAEAGVPTLLMREVAAAGGRGEWGLLRGALRRGVQFVSIVSVCLSALGLVILMLLGDGMQPVGFWTLALMLLVPPAAALGKTVGHALRGLHRVVTAQAIELLLRPAVAIGLVAAVFHFAPALRTPQVAMAAQLGAVIVTMIAAGAFLKQVTPVRARHFQPEFRTWEWLKSARAFIFIAGGLTINNYTDVVMLGWFSSVDDVGIYRVAAQGATLVIFGLQAASAVLAPRFSRLHAQGDKIRLQRLTTLSVYAIATPSLCIALALALNGPAILEFVFGIDFVPAYGPLLILISGQLGVAIFGVFGPLLTACGYELLQSRAVWVSVIINVILNAILIPSLGSVGAAISTALTFSGWGVYLFWISHTRLGISIFSVPSRRQSRG